MRRTGPRYYCLSQCLSVILAVFSFHTAGSNESSDPADTRPHIVAFGDSLTAGLGVNRDEAYPAQLQRRLDELHYRYRVINAGDKRRESQVRSFIRSGANNRQATTKIIDMTKVTRVGRLIRKTSMDELPQLLNVVRGEMSLVGPRPCLSYELENYDDWHRRRLNVLPGCTGVWQVLARSKVGFHEMVLQDLFYVYRFTLTLDIWVMLKTLPVMFFGKGGE